MHGYREQSRWSVSSAAGSSVMSAVLMSFFALGAWASLYAYTRPSCCRRGCAPPAWAPASRMARVAGVLAPLLGGLLIPVSLGLTLAVYALASRSPR